MERNEENATPEPEVFPLDDACASILAEITNQMNQLNAQRQGALVLFLRQHKLQGNWQLAENGRELFKAPAQMPAPVPAPPAA